MAGVPTYMQTSGGLMNQAVGMQLPQQVYNLPDIGAASIQHAANDYVSWDQIVQAGQLTNPNATAWNVSNNPDLTIPRGPGGETGANLFASPYTIFTDSSMAWSPDTMAYLNSIGETGVQNTLPPGGIFSEPRANGLLDIGSPEASGRDLVLYNNNTKQYYYPTDTVHAGGASGAAPLPYTGFTPNQTPVAIPNSPLNTTVTFQAPGTALSGGNGQAFSPLTDLAKKQQGSAANSGLQTQGIGSTLLSSDNTLLKQLVGS